MVPRTPEIKCMLYAAVTWTVDILGSGDAYLCQRIVLPLLQAMIYRLFVINPSGKPLLKYCQLRSQKKWVWMWIYLFMKLHLKMEITIFLCVPVCVECPVTDKNIKHFVVVGIESNYWRRKFDVLYKLIPMHTPFTSWHLLTIHIEKAVCNNIAKVHSSW